MHVTRYWGGTVQALGAGILSQRMKKAVKKKGVGREGKEWGTGTV
jgi:hypothetical protein